MVGGGAAGLAAAIVLRARGARVRVLEQGPVVGGRLTPMVLGPFAFGSGEESFAGPQILGRLFARAGHRLSDFVEFAPLDPAASLVFPDGERLAVHRSPDRLAEEIARFSKADAHRLETLWRKWESRARAVDERFTTQPGRGWRGLAECAASPRAWPFAASAASPRTLDGWVRRRFAGDRGMRQVFAWLASRHGVSPHRAPAGLAYPLIMDAMRGAWMAQGGVGAVREALLRLASLMDVRMTRDACVERIETENGAVHTVSGRGFKPLRADVVVAAMNPAKAAAMLSPTEPIVAAAKRLERRRTGRSAFAISLILRESARIRSDARETMLLGPGPREAARQIDGWLVPAASPDIHLYDYGESDGLHGLRIVVQQPPQTARWRWSAATIAQERERVLKRLSKAGVDVRESNILEEVVLSPAEFAKAHGLAGGSLYGLWGGSWRAAFLRPPQSSPLAKGLYHAGSFAHPGAALHLALQSGILAAESAL